MVFMNRSEVTLVCVSRTGESVAVLKQHLEFLFGQIVFILTKKVWCVWARTFVMGHGCRLRTGTLTSPSPSPLQVIDSLQSAASFDLRSLLGGTMPSLRGILHMASNGPSVAMEAVPMLPMPPVDRARVLSTITSCGAKDILCVLVCCPLSFPSPACTPPLPIAPTPFCRSLS